MKDDPCDDDPDQSTDAAFAAEAAAREKMKQDWVIGMHSIASQPAPFDRVRELMEKCGWVRDDEEWQEAAQALFQGGVINISARKNGTIFEVWFG